MKTILFFIAVIAFAGVRAQYGTKKDPEIEKTVRLYAQLGDIQDANALKKILHDQHRLVWHDGEKPPFIADKNSYIAKIESKEWGGDKRKVTIESVESFDGVNATVKAILDGEKSQMRSLFSLIKSNGSWQIVEELVNASFK
ncbi:MAG: nuclear transport factor 2 family protein [Cyclobacteriaceae bacterium]